MVQVALTRVGSIFMGLTFLAVPSAWAADCDMVRGERAFAKCKACHSLEPGDHGAGPSLNGVLGTKAGFAEGFRFSRAMIDSGLVFDEATLLAFIEDPASVVPGNVMAFRGLKKSEDRAAVICFLEGTEAASAD